MLTRSNVRTDCLKIADEQMDSYRIKVSCVMGGESLLSLTLTDTHN